MRIGYILYQPGVISGRSNGVRSQAISCFKILNEFGDECVLIDNWKHYDWKTFDAIHIYGYDLAIHTFVKALSLVNPNIYISPIIDSTKPYGIYKLSTFNGFEKLRLYSNNYALGKALKIVKGVCARSEHEARFYIKSFGMQENKVFIVPLPFAIKEPSSINDIISMKESFCLHVSSLYQDRKNVKRLVEAAKKYNFELILAGSMGRENDFNSIKLAIGSANNIKVLGYVTNEDLINLYTKAKVFALPSTNEGVGIVALDAGIYGCNIALTDIKGPKEYYPTIDTVELVDPYNVDSIGKKIVKLLKTPNNTDLSTFIKKSYSKSQVLMKLHNMYNS
ncbi:glycosyltransferase family 4 protein [Flavobacterium sp. LC2016-12]|uniref:glycosyltransferase family 4 protein n=1 Tax=Flavobacterium sp. LC2016-12 TaxID=2783794 RepID=UPI00188BCA14|nr:glycosyltransferase family 4 protein [Flavobacterium sp. LC2016-12]MBF4465677.1 glycosyltransferase family 4 protein [Flavobacterium sp. LC2016-12]